MGSGDTHGLGYERVDDDPNVDVLLQTMDETSRWEATRQLRSWESTQLDLRPGDRLLDVGCGQGHAALDLAAALGPSGVLVGVDASEEMIRAARSRLGETECSVSFVVGDATAIGEADGSFDAARSERVLQWLPDPQLAVNELVRVVRPGGVVSLIDSDWSTYSLEVGDDAIVEGVRAAFQEERRRASNVGSRLDDLARRTGLVVDATTKATQLWTRWDPDASPAPAGCFSMASLADDLIDRGRLEPDGRDRFVTTIHDAAREGRFSMSLTMYAVVARA